MSDDFDLTKLSLGRKTEYRKDYDPELLQAVPRSLNRSSLGAEDQLHFSGVDVWHGYELSWLNAKGKPVVALARFTYSASTPNIIESKSFKLYLNSFNQFRCASHDEAKAILQADLSRVVGGEVDIELIAPDDVDAMSANALPGECIDDIDISIDKFELTAEELALVGGSEPVSETLHSHLLKSNCLITNQPDWASVVIEYTGPKIKREALLRYLISFRLHNEFHEHCVERIYSDICKACKPQKLSVQALYTRRGGLDINPYRTSFKDDSTAPLLRTNRQ